MSQVAKLRYVGWVADDINVVYGQKVCCEEGNVRWNMEMWVGESMIPNLWIRTPSVIIFDRVHLIMETNR